MIFDFSMSIEDWMGLFQKLLDIVTDFFAKLGIQLFEEEEETAPEEGDVIATV